MKINFFKVVVLALVMASLSTAGYLTLANSEVLAAKPTISGPVKVKPSHPIKPPKAISNPVN